MKIHELSSEQSSGKSNYFHAREAAGMCTTEREHDKEWDMAHSESNFPAQHTSLFTCLEVKI